MLVTDGVIIESPDSNKYERDVGIIIYDPDATQEMLAEEMLVDTPYTVMASYAVNSSARYNDTLFVKHIIRNRGKQSASASEGCPTSVTSGSGGDGEANANDEFLDDDIPF